MVDKLLLVDRCSSGGCRGEMQVVHMDAGRLRGLAGTPHSSASLKKRSQYVPPTILLRSIPPTLAPTLPPTLAPTLAIFREGRQKEKKTGARSSLVGAAVAHDIAAVAVAAATVIPMYWMYLKSSKYFTVFESPQSKSSSLSTDTTALAGNGSAFPSLKNAVAESGNGSAFSSSNNAVAEANIYTSVLPLAEETSRTMNENSLGVDNLIGENHRRPLVRSELEKDDCGPYSCLEHSIANSAEELSGTSEELPAELPTRQLEDLWPASISDVSGTAEIGFITTSALATQKIEVLPKFSGLMARVNNSVDSFIAGPIDAFDGSLEANTEVPDVANGTLIVSETIDEYPVEDKSCVEAGLLENDIVRGKLGPLVSKNNFVSIAERRKQIENSLYEALERGAGTTMYGKVNGQMQWISPAAPSLDSSNPVHIPQIKSRKLRGKLRKPANGDFSIPENISDILPVKESTDSEFYLMVYEKLLRAGRLQDCVVLLEEMDKLKKLDTSKIYHSNFFKACQKQKAVREGFRFLRLIGRPTMSTFNMLLCVCREARDVDAGLKVLSATERAGFKADFILYTSLISTCSKACKVDVAFKVFHEMETAGITPSIATYGAMIDGCAQSGQIAKAFGVYGTMLSKQLKPDLVIFNSLINACGRAGAIDRAFDVLADMRGNPCFLKPNNVTIGALISGCARAGQVERAFGVYKNMHEWGITGTAECYTSLVHACKVDGNLSLALSVFQDMKRDGVKPDETFFSALIDVAGQSKDVNAAFGILDEMKDVAVDPGAITYSALMGVCCNTGKWERALEVYKILKAAPFLPTVSTFNALITTLCDAQKLYESFSILQDMKQSGLQPDVITYSILLEACRKFDEPERAFDLYTSGRAEGVVPNESICASVIGLCYSRLQKNLTSPTYSYSIGLLAGQGTDAPYEQWTSWAIAVYRHAVAANVVPSIKSLSLLLGCLRIPEVHEFNIADDTFGHTSNTTLRSSSILDGAGLYDPRALSIFDEAALMGVVPQINSRGGPTYVNAESMPSYVAEVYLVTLLKGLKQMHKNGEKLYPMSIHYSTEKKQILTAPKKVKEVTVSGRTGQALASLLRRVRLHFQGHESSGKLRISTVSLRNWLKHNGKLSSAMPHVQRHHEFAPPHTFVAQGIAEQQRAIRMGQVFKTPADMGRVSGNSSLFDMYGTQRTPHVNPWDRGQNNYFDFDEDRSRSGQRKPRNPSPGK